MVDVGLQRNIHMAALYNQSDQIRTLVSEGADVNSRDRRLLTPLHFAAREYSLDAIAVLLELGAEVDAVDVYGNSPLSAAVFDSMGRGEAITVLLEAGADRDLENNYGVSPLSLARTIANYDAKQYFDPR